MGDTVETRPFEAEVSRVLDLVARSLYSDRSIFLRELISNASDACDRLRHRALTDPALLGDDPELRITVRLEPHRRTIVVTDNGIGMSREELIENLGTIARSGTAAFVEQMSGDAEADSGLIGQFGVGFYSSYMVADRVDVLSRPPGAATGWHWSSDGRGEFTVSEDDAAPARGTVVRVHLRAEHREFMQPERLREIVRRYSDHIPLPIFLETGEGEPEHVNEASALWARAARDITSEQYTEFYRHVSHAFDEPWLTVHFKSEGRVEYTCLLFVPTTRPFDIFYPERGHHVKLYVRRVFVADDYEELVPPYLRFLAGVVDSEDLPLNISRETLQENPLVRRIRERLTRQVLRALARKAEKEPEEYPEFWEQFGSVLKEGLAVDADHRAELFALARFETTAGNAKTGLAEYVERMPEGQDAIYYLSGEDLDRIRHSPHLEAFRARGVEVLLMTDPVDEVWLSMVPAYEEKPFRSVTRGAVDLDAIKTDGEGNAEKEQEELPEGMEALIERLGGALGDSVKQVRVSHRLTDSPVCLAADEFDPDLHLARMLRERGTLTDPLPRILEINPGHRIIRRLAGTGIEDGVFQRTAHLLLDQARLLEGESLPDAAAFASRLAETIEEALPAVN